MRDHTWRVPLDHAQPEGDAIDVFAREVVASDKQGEDLPWLLFLQGGPGGMSPRPPAMATWLKRALQDYRVLLLDQRGTGRSTPLNAKTVDTSDAKSVASYIRHFRADSIVADAELIRRDLVGDDGRWDTLGQSYGGFVTLTYLSFAPHGLRRCLVTGGLPPLTATAEEVYARTVPRIARRNRDYYARYPDDVGAVRRIADHLDGNDVRLPNGDRLSARRFRLLGDAFGMSDGFERLHWLVETAWHGARLSDRFLYGVMTITAAVDGPVYALQEFCYTHGNGNGNGNGASAWAAQRAIDADPAFAPEADPLLFTGETMFPWMFDEIASLRPFRDAAHLLAEADDWAPLYYLERLSRNEVPVMAAVYFDDMYVDADLSLRTVDAVPHIRPWVTNEWEHDGLRVSDGKVLDRLLAMAGGHA
jgi:pimeloyl-ACP methyl ester carboxylesterase